MEAAVEKEHREVERLAVVDLAEAMLVVAVEAAATAEDQTGKV